MGTYRESDSGITIFPGPQSYHAQDSATIQVKNGMVDSIADDHGQPLASYELEPVLITGLSEDANRTKRRLITYDEIPQNLVHAVLAIEDRRFFEHSGVNYFRLVEAVIRDLTTGQKQQGGSTLTMQLARGFFLTPEKRIKRKIIEIVITFQLEHRFSKKQIFEIYANQINLGQRGSFAINGFGEASQSYFGKDVRQLDLAESALLAGMIQRPNYFSPYRHPDRALSAATWSWTRWWRPAPSPSSRRSTPRLNRCISPRPASTPAKRPTLSTSSTSSCCKRSASATPTSKGCASTPPSIPTCNDLPPRLSIPTIHVVDEQVEKLHARRNRVKKAQPPPAANSDHLSPGRAGRAQSAHRTGAGAGGRTQLRHSQVNHAVAHRPTGSIFKPLVYAAAFQTAVEGTPLSGQDKLFSPVTIAATDQQSTYMDGDKEYSPKNFEGNYHDQVTARYALQWSLNNATIGLASMVGFDRVAALARDAGVKSARGTPSVAIGSYDATPLDMAGAYTVFANSGVHIDPWMLASVRTANGDVMTEFTPNTKQVLDPRVAYLTTNMMEAVLNGGTAGRVRTRSASPRPPREKPAPATTPGSPASPAICSASYGSATTITPISRSRARRRPQPIWAEFMKQCRPVAAVLRHQGVHAPRRSRPGQSRQGDESPARLRLPRDIHGRIPRRHRPHRYLQPSARPPHAVPEDLRAGQQKRQLAAFKVCELEERADLLTCLLGSASRESS